MVYYFVHPVFMCFFNETVLLEDSSYNIIKCKGNAKARTIFSNTILIPKSLFQVSDCFA